MKKLILSLLLLAPVAVSAQTMKFGHIDAQNVMQQMPEFIKANGELQAMAKEYENELTAMQEELQRKVEEYENSASTMNETKRKETEENLYDLNSKIQQAYQDNSQALQKAQQEKMAPITSKLVEAIRIVGEAGNYIYIMDVSAGIPYISEKLSTDVTDAVKSELNKLK